METESKTIKLKEHYEVNIGKWIEKGWKIFWADIYNFIILSLIYSAILLIVGGLTAGVGLLFIWGPLNIGFFYIIINNIKNKKKRFDFSELAKGFDYYISSVLANILILAFLLIGFAFCIIPGIVILAFYLFVYIFIFEHNMDFWEAMEASRKIVSKHIFEFSVFALIHLILYFIGTMFCFIGIIPIISLVNCTIVVAYDELIGITE
ncbi:hypothetical protein DRQ09_00810 [candidate division KSB1 bacterium]|nr:MAG: hypothetical protein DRQ09_00810 [candidate division KSB1 bacterium]